MFQIKCLSKCPYFQKPPLPWKILGYAPLQLTEWTDLNVFLIYTAKQNIFDIFEIFFSLNQLFLHLFHFTNITHHGKK